MRNSTAPASTVTTTGSTSLSTLAARRLGCSAFRIRPARLGRSPSITAGEPWQRTIDQKSKGTETVMAKVEITRTELVWPGKYNEDGTLKEVPRVSLPFQVIETINE